MAPLPPPHNTYRTTQRREKPAAGLTQEARPYGGLPSPRAWVDMALKKTGALLGLRQPSLAAGMGKGLGLRGGTLRGPLKDSGLALCPRVAGTFHGFSWDSTEPTGL